MKKLMISVAAVAILLGVIGPAFSNGGNDGDQTSISVSPQTLLLSSEQSGYVTVHTNIPLAGQVDVTLEDIPATHIYADNRGHLVAKFSEDEVKAIVSPPTAVLTLTIDGIAVGADTVRVLE